YIAAASGSPTLSIFDVATGKIVQTLTGSTTGYTQSAYSPDGKYMIAGGTDQSFLWDTASGKLLHIFPVRGCCTSVRFTPDGKYMVLGNEGPNTIQFYDVVSWQLVREFVGHQVGGWVAGIAFTPDSKEMVSASSDGTARLWEVATGRFIHYIGDRGGVH